MQKTVVNIWLELLLIISCIQTRINFDISSKMWEAVPKQKHPGHISQVYHISVAFETG